ncbi:unnamed protein product [Prorocentrum cordatum]|uniref:Uncharacterized protein n=1 Tax=Prorocentrum cordatum TaxID=2364126 RepID=A0ABN9VPE6_9DINO|nr:unnamed protein product [Polarella glacialis]
MAIREKALAASAGPEEAEGTDDTAKSKQGNGKKGSKADNAPGSEKAADKDGEEDLRAAIALLEKRGVSIGEAEKAKVVPPKAEGAGDQVPRANTHYSVVQTAMWRWSHAQEKLDKARTAADAAVDAPREAQERWNTAQLDYTKARQVVLLIPLDDLLQCWGSVKLCVGVDHLTLAVHGRLRVIELAIAKGAESLRGELEGIGFKIPFAGGNVISCSLVVGSAPPGLDEVFRGGGLASVLHAARVRGVLDGALQRARMAGEADKRSRTAQVATKGDGGWRRGLTYASNAVPLVAWAKASCVRLRTPAAFEAMRGKVGLDFFGLGPLGHGRGPVACPDFFRGRSPVDPLCHWCYAAFGTQHRGLFCCDGACQLVASWDL